MHRVPALLLIPALIATSGVVSSLHTHAYLDHDHPEHHHGLSAHEHHPAPARHDDGVAHVAGCDPGQHTISFAFLCAAPPQVHAGDVEVALPSSPIGELQIQSTIEYSDVRVHGPPPRTQASPRSPPLIAHT
ncbi:MAG: hypothetical protein GEU82_14955 [Luteitalea sp.]|nr:hypothetical protein [Luteitalea sp.]